MAKKKKTKKSLSKKIKNPDYIIYTDGGCAFNPGGPGGIGAVVINQKTGEETEICKGYVSTTNNRMEISAVIESLRILPDKCTIRLYSDSQYTLNCMVGLWSKKKNTDLWEELEELEKGKQIEPIWIRGHSGNEYNERCDRLAVKGMSSLNKQVDEGFLAAKQAGRDFYEDVNTKIQEKKIGGAMSVDIVIPEELQDKEPPIMSHHSYAEKYGVKSTCAKAIMDFYLVGNRSFKAYIPLKTGGIDQYSRKTAEKIASESSNPDLYLETLRKYLNDEKDVNAAARWNARGLSLLDSIRKVLVDAEIRENCRR